MDNFSFYSPTYFVFGKETEKQAGKYVKVSDTVKGFKEILDGKLDDLPEQNFYMKGDISEVRNQK